MLVMVMGNLMTKEKRAKVVEAENLLHNNPSVTEVLPWREGVMRMFTKVHSQLEYDWAGEYFEHLLQCLDSADRAVFMSDGENIQTRGWLLGYCFSHGIPVVLIQDEDDITDYTSDIFVSHSITASLGTLQELETYDFVEANSIFTSTT